MLTPRDVSDAWAEALAELLATSPVNLVSRADRHDVRRIHIDECVRIGRQLAVSDGEHWVDLGTGGGLPGLVLAEMYPASRWTLVDARRKKAREVVRFAQALEMTNVRAIHARAEDLADAPSHAAAYAGVVSRAVASLVETIALGRPLIRDGVIVAVRGPRAPDEYAVLSEWADDLAVERDGLIVVEGTIRPTWLVRVRGQGRVDRTYTRTQLQARRGTRGG